MERINDFFACCKNALILLSLYRISSCDIENSEFWFQFQLFHLFLCQEKTCFQIKSKFITEQFLVTLKNYNCNTIMNIKRDVLNMPVLNT
jgi:hypothetical protein